MRKTKIHAILTEISEVARTYRTSSDCTPMYKYNDLESKQSILKAKDKINELCTKLENEIFD